MTAIGPVGLVVFTLAYFSLRVWFYNRLKSAGCRPLPRNYITLFSWLGPTSRYSRESGDPSIRRQGRVVEAVSVALMSLALASSILFWP